MKIITPNIPGRMKWNDSQGMLMAEALIALAIFAIGILAVASLLINANLSLRSASENTEASMLAENQLETLLGMRYSTMLAAYPTNLGSRTVGKYTVRWQFDTSQLPTADPKLAQAVVITVTTQWTGRSALNKDRQVQVSFIRSNTVSRTI